MIRVVARDGTRYSYIVWIDAETKLPMRVDLLDRDGETLEQFRVISFDVNGQVGNSMQNLAKASLPPLLSVPAAILSISTGYLHGSRKDSAKYPAAVASCRLSKHRLNRASIPMGYLASR